MFFSIVFPIYSQPVNDNVNDNITWQGIGGLPSFAGNNIGATKEVNEPNHAGNIGGSSIWYSYDSYMLGRQVITTNGSDFDTILSLYYLDAGNFTNPPIDFTPLVTVASNDDVGIGQTSRVDLEIFSNSITDSYSANNVKTFNLAIVKSTQVPMFGFWDQSALTLLLSVFGVIALRKHSIKIFKQ